MEYELPLISIKEARKIMGKDGDSLTDDQVEQLVLDLDMIAMLQLGIVPDTKKI